MTVAICRVYQWEERLGIEREQSLSKSSPDLSRLVGLDVVTISFCMLDWSAMIPQFILYVQFFISMTKYLAESMASLISFHFYMEVETEFIGLTIAFTSLCWNVSE